jgi:hypothetical protein
LDVDIDLNGDRHAVELALVASFHPCSVSGTGLCDRLSAEINHHGVDRRIDRAHSVNMSLHDLFRGHTPVADCGCCINGGPLPHGCCHTHSPHDIKSLREPKTGEQHRFSDGHPERTHQLGCSANAGTLRRADDRQDGLLLRQSRSSSDPPELGGMQKTHLQPAPGKPQKSAIPTPVSFYAETTRLLHRRKAGQSDRSC